MSRTPAVVLPGDDDGASALAGALMITLTLVGWSCVPLFLRYFAESIDAWTSNGWRYGFSAFLWAPVVIFGLLRRRLPPGVWRAALIPSLVNSGGQVAFTWSHYKIDPGLLTFGLRSQIVFAAVGAYLLFPNERRVVRSKSYLGGGLAVIAGTAGALMLGDETFQGAHVAGVGLSVLSGFLFASYGIAVRKYMRGVNSVVAFAVISQYTAFAMVALMLMLGDDAGATAITGLTFHQFLLLLFSAVIGIALGHVFYYMSIARLGVAVSAGVLQLQPFGVAVGSWYLFSEHLNAAQWASGLFAVGGAVLMLLVQWRISGQIRREAGR